MDGQDATPRVNFSTLARHHNRKVLMCCAVQSVENGQVRVKTSDGGDVVVLTEGRQPYDSKHIEVLGTVVDPKTIQEESHVDLSDNFDLNIYDELVKLTHRDAYSGMAFA